MQFKNYRQLKANGCSEIFYLSGKVVIRQRVFDSNTGQELDPKIQCISIKHLMKTQLKLLNRQTEIANELADLDQMMADMVAEAALVAEEEAKA